MNLGHLLFYTHGRISRKMWWFSNILIWLLSAITFWVYRQYGFHDALFGMVITLVFFWFKINVNIKRLHDHGHSGWGVFWRIVLSEVWGVGWVYGLIVFGCLGGTEGENQHGASP